MALTISIQWKVQGVVCFLIFILLGVACQHEHPGVSDLRAGTDGNRQAFVGGELPVTAHIAVDAPVDRADVAIRPASGAGWAFAGEYSEGLGGKTHAPFEAAVAIPDTVEPGDYILVFRITDAEGNVSADSVDFKLAIDSTVPTASDLDVGINAAGNDLHLESELSAPLAIAKVVVEVKGIAWEETFIFSGTELAGQLSLRFHEHVKVGEAPKGSYHVCLVVEDSKGRTARTEGTFTK